MEPVPPPPAAARRPALLPRLYWEAALMVLAAVALAVARGRLAGPDASALWAYVGITGFLASGFAFSLRTGTPNLAVGAVAALAGVLFAGLGNDLSGPVAGLVVVAGLAVVGLLVGLLVGLTPIPAWAATLAALAVFQGLAVLAADGQQIVPIAGDPLDATWYPVLAIAFVVVSAGGGLIWLLPRADAAAGRRLPAALVGLGLSNALAACSGVLLAGYLGAGQPTQSGWTFAALAAAVLGGTSVLGRRGGVAGTVFAVILVVSADRALATEEYRVLDTELVWGLLLLIGLVVGVVLDRLTHPPRRPTTT